MSFSTKLACSVGDIDFASRAAYLFEGDLDEFSEEGILLRRASDSIIFSQTPEEAAASALAGGAAPETATEAMKKAEEAVDEAPAPNPAASDSDAADVEPLASHPGIAAALAFCGIADPQAAALAEQGARDALATISFNNALFSVRDLEKHFAKGALSPALASPHWPAARLEIFGVLELDPVVPTEPDGPNKMIAPRAFMDMELEMIELAKRETDAHPIPQELVDAVLSTKPTMAEEQRMAAIASCSGKKAVVVTEGTAGAGKSFTLNAIREVYEKAPPSKPGEEEGYDIIGTALSWTATKVLEESAGLSGGRAIQGLTMAMDEAKSGGGDFFKRRTILIVDEAGLVGVKHMHKILWHAANSSQSVRVLLTGDSLQLCPVEAGNALEAIVEECGSSRLDTIRRQKQASHRAAVKHFCYGRAENGLWTYWQQEAIHFSADATERRELVMRDYVRYCVSNPKDVALVLALENAEVKTLNTEIRARLKLVGRLLGDEFEMTVTDGRGAYKAPFCVGDQIVLRKNKVDHPVFKSAFEKIFNGAADAQRRGVDQATQGGFAKLIAQWKREASERREASKNRPKPSARALGPHLDGSAETQEEDDESKPLRTGIFNRTTGLVLDIRRNPDVQGALLFRILLAEGGEIEIDTSKYFDEKAGAVPLHHNFATTIYASQGQTVQKVLIMDSPYMNRRLAYVGMSRHTMSCDIYADCSEIEARVAKDGARVVERAWKRFERDTISERGFEQMRLAKLKKVISEWEPDAGKRASAYLQAMANSWNVDSANPTVWVARKQLSKKMRTQAAGGRVGYPRPAPEDDVDDLLAPLRDSDPASPLVPRLEEPYLFEDLEMGAKLHAPKPKGFLTQLAAKKKGAVEPEEVLLPLVTSDRRESSDLPDWAASPAVSQDLAEAKGKAWGPSRFGQPRFFSVDPASGKPTSRWGFDGSLKAGDGEPAVLLNEAGGPLSPWMVVQGPREAWLSYAHYRKARESAPERIPHIVAAMPACDLSALSSWVKPGAATLHCAWSEKTPGSLDWAQKTAGELRSLGHSATVHPPVPAPGIKAKGWGAPKRSFAP